MSFRNYLTRFCALVLFSFFALWPTASARADEIAVWNFNDSDFFVDHGNGMLNSNFNLTNLVFTLGGSTLNARFGDVAGQSLGLQAGSALVNNTRYISMTVSTVGYANIVISFASQATSTGFNNNKLQYSLDGITFFDFGSAYSPPSTYGVFTFDLSSIAGLNNNPNAAFRIVFDGASSSAGNNRIDNLVVEGQSIVIPEPASVVLLSLGLGGYVASRLRRKRARSR